MISHTFKTLSDYVLKLHELNDVSAALGVRRFQLEVVTIEPNHVTEVLTAHTHNNNRNGQLVVRNFVNRVHRLFHVMDVTIRHQQNDVVSLRIRVLRNLPGALLKNRREVGWSTHFKLWDNLLIGFNNIIDSFDGCVSLVTIQREAMRNLGLAWRHSTEPIKRILFIRIILV